jgi:hypothetical protein
MLGEALMPEVATGTYTTVDVRLSKNCVHILRSVERCSGELVYDVPLPASSGM